MWVIQLDTGFLGCVLLTFLDVTVQSLHSADSFIQPVLQSTTHTLACAEHDYLNASPKSNNYEEIQHYRSQYSARLGAHPNGLVLNLMAQTDNR
jgi:hypothetical protein